MQWMMLQQNSPEDFVIATGNQYTVREFIVMSAYELGVRIIFEGSGVDEIGIVDSVLSDKASNVKNGDVIVRIDRKYFRPTEVETLLGDPAYARQKLGWEPEITIGQLCAEMISEDLANAQKIAFLKKHGHSTLVGNE